jgi:glycosyltransferase involved in cell wall biosynthesis
MTIGIEAERANNPVKTGVEHYAKQLILHLAELDKTNKYILYLRTKPESWFLKLPANFEIKVIPFPIFWTQLRISWEMFWHPVDVLFIPASALPIYHPKKSVVTIHDVAWRYYPETFTKFMRNFLEYSTRFAVKKASKIIAVSDATKKDLEKFYHIDPNKIEVIPHGYESITNIPELSSEVKNKVPEKYVLFISTLQPRKNVIGLIRAFRKLKNENPDLPHKLVLAGRVGWRPEETLAEIEKNRDIVIHLGHVKDDDRWALLKNSSCFVTPSFYEGFGMPILEAFQAGAPVATSNISSMPEVAGEAAEYFDPHNIDQIKSAIIKIIKNKPHADELSARGKERLKEFSWEKCAEATLRIIVS